MDNHTAILQWIEHAAHVVAGLCIFSATIGIVIGIFIGLRLAMRDRP